MLRALLAIAFTLALAIPAHADECVPTTSVTTDRTIVVDVGPADAGGLLWRYHVWDRCNEPDVDPSRPQPVALGPCVISSWQYFESNDIEGLQRGDEMHDDTCGGLINSDTIIS